MFYDPAAALVYTQNGVTPAALYVLQIATAVLGGAAIILYFMGGQSR